MGGWEELSIAAAAPCVCSVGHSADGTCVDAAAVPTGPSMHAWRRANWLAHRSASACLECGEARPASCGTPSGALFCQGAAGCVPWRAANACAVRSGAGADRERSLQLNEPRSRQVLGPRASRCDGGSRGQEVKRSRGQEVKRSRGQEVKRSRHHEVMRSHDGRVTCSIPSHHVNDGSRGLACAKATASASRPYR
jgi:hypothetical protein